MFDSTENQVFLVCAGEHASANRFLYLLARVEEVLIVRDFRDRYAERTQAMLERYHELLALWNGAKLSLFDGERGEINRSGVYGMVRWFLFAGKRAVVLRNGKSEVL